MEVLDALDRSGFVELLNSIWRRAMLKFRGISKFIGNPEFLSLTHMGVHFYAQLNRLGIIVENTTFLYGTIRVRGEYAFFSVRVKHLGGWLI